MNTARTIGVVAALAVGVFSYMKNRPESAEDADYKTLVKPAFTVELPAWSVEVNEGTSGVGKYKVASSSAQAFAEASWQSGSPTLPEEMKAIADGLVEGFGLVVDSEKVDDTIAGQYRHELLASLKGKVWMSVVMIDCKATNVLVTLGFSSVDKNDSKFMSQKALKSFQCKGDSPDGFAGFPKISSSLDSSFGKFEEADGVTLASSEGHIVMTYGVATSALASLRKYPEKVLSMFASLLEMKLTKSSSLREQKGYDGATQWLISASVDDTEQTLVWGGFACPSASAAYITLALSDAEGADVATLDGIIRKIGCPSEGSDNLRNRASACEVGAEQFCDEPAEPIEEVAPE